MGSKYTEAQKRAAVKYMAAKTDNIQLRLPKGTKEAWQAAAEAQGYPSMTAFVKAAVEAFSQVSGE